MLGEVMLELRDVVVEYVVVGAVFIARGVEIDAMGVLGYELSLVLVVLLVYFASRGAGTPGSDFTW